MWPDANGTGRHLCPSPAGTKFKNRAITSTQKAPVNVGFVAANGAALSFAAGATATLNGAHGFLAVNNAVINAVGTRSISNTNGYFATLQSTIIATQATAQLNSSTGLTAISSALVQFNGAVVTNNGIHGVLVQEDSYGVGGLCQLTTNHTVNAAGFDAIATGGSLISLGGCTGAPPPTVSGNVVP